MEEKAKGIKNKVQSKNHKLKIYIFISIILNIIVIIILGCLIYLYLKKGNNNKNSNEKSIENINNIKENNENNNLISAIYSVKSGQKVQLLNPEKINLKEDDYLIEIKENNKNLRFLENIEVENGYYIPNESGYLPITISFKKSLNNLNEIFQNNKELIKVDLSNLDMQNVLSMNSTFSGCSNLEEIIKFRKY